LFAGGYVGYGAYLKTVTRINESGTLLGENLTPDVLEPAGLQSGAAAGIAGVGLFYSFQQLVRMDSSGSRLSYQQPTLTSNFLLGGAGLDNSVALFYAGEISDDQGTDPPTYYLTNAVNRFDSGGTQLGTESFVGTQRFNFAMAGAASCAIAYGGMDTWQPLNTYNLVTRLNSSGALVGSETIIGVGNTGSAAAGAQANDGVIFYGGISSGLVVNKVLKVNSLGTQVGVESSVGNTTRWKQGGAGF
jgi:hypothetical protein